MKDFIKPKFTERDVADLQLVNWLAKKDYKKEKFCYLVKDVLIQAYGTPDGFDLQSFTRTDWREYAYGDTFSWHEHVLARYKIGDTVFHRPTNEFSYSDIRDRHKQSKNFEEYKAKCSGSFEGLKDAPENFEKHEAQRALRRIVHKFKSVLREKIKKPERTLFWFFKEKLWWGIPDGYLVRIPPGVAVCSGCEARLEAQIGRYDCENIEREELTEFLLIYCDSDRHGENKCPEQIKWFRFRMDNRRDNAWVTERATAARWLQETFPKFLEWKTAQTVAEPVQIEPVGESETVA